MTHKSYVLAAILAGTFLASPAMARDLSADPLAKERFQIRVRALGVLPDEDTSVNIAGKTSVGDAITPEVDLTYFFTPNIAAELIAATSQHQVNYTGDVNLGDAWILPPTLTLQYHFTPDRTISPYVGAGINYSYFYGETTNNAFNDLEVEGGWGTAVQAGADIWVNQNWGLNLDVKKLFLNVDGKLNGGAIRTDIDLDPWIVGAGVSYRF